MTEQLIEILQTFGYPVRRQGSLAPDETYPSSFFTFWNGSTNDWHHYDNTENGTVWAYTVYFYSTDPALTHTVLTDAKRRLRNGGWIVDGVGFDVPSDEDSHTGRAIDIIFINTED